MKRFIKIGFYGCNGELARVLSDYKNPPKKVKIFCDKCMNYHGIHIWWRDIKDEDIKSSEVLFLEKDKEK